MDQDMLTAKGSSEEETHLKMPRISIFGLGYVGTVYAAGFASKKIEVIGFDIDEKKLKLLASGISPIYEPGLSELVKDCVHKDLLKTVSTAEDAVLNSDVTFITVGTPSNSDGSIDLKYITETSRVIGEALKKKDRWHLVTVKSTVIPGTTEKVVKKIVEAASGKTAYKHFGLGVNPEFLREGSAVEDFMTPDRIVIGVSDEKSKVELERIYSGFSCPKLVTNIRTAELIKYVNNAFLAAKVSFINMIANLCQKIPNCDVTAVAEGIGLDKRIGKHFLRAGAGWGGSCWLKDLNALTNFARKNGLTLPLIDATLQVNDMQPFVMVELARQLIGKLSNRRVVVLGLAFKPNTDDMREAISIKIVNMLLNEGAEVTVYDPAAISNAKEIFRDTVNYASSANDCIHNADCALIVTEWDEFKSLKPEDFVRHMRIPAVVDGRRIFSPQAFSSKLRFAAIGLGANEYFNPALAVNAMIVSDSEKILLVRRTIEPFNGLWSLPGGFVEHDETVEEALTREVEEETGLKIRPKQIFDVFSHPLRSPVKHVVTMCYLADVLGGSLKSSNESLEARFFSASEIPARLAFDHHEIVEKYMKSQREYWKTGQGLVYG